MVAKVKVITPDNLGKTIQRGVVEPDKWDVKHDTTQFELKDGALHLKDAVLQPLKDADVVSGVLQGSDLVLTKVDGSRITVPLASLVPAAKADQFLKEVTYDSGAKKLKFKVGNDTDSNTTDLEVNVADLLPVVVGNGLSGDGTSGNPLTLKVKSGEPFTVTSTGLAVDKNSDNLIELTDGTGDVSLGLIFKK